MKKWSNNEDILKRHPLFIKNKYSIFSGRAGNLLNEIDVKTGILEVGSLVIKVDLALTVPHGKFSETRILLS